jgi:uncharacterized membrane protein
MERTHTTPSDSAHYVNLERLIFLVDGVFAITITLLVLELRPPEDSLTRLADGLLEMLPRLYIYLIAFYSIANHWVVHQRMFRHITGADTKMLWLTLLGLLFITLIPATTAIVGRFPSEGLAVATFSANSFFQAFVNWVFWGYVLKRHNQFAAQSDPQLLKITTQVWLVISVGWLVSIPLGFLNVYVAYAAWIIWPNLVALWGNAKRNRLQVLPAKEGGRDVPKKNKA